MKFLIALLLFSSSAFAVNKNLPYPEEVTANELSRQLYFNNHYFYLSPFPLENQMKGINVVVKKTPSGKIYTNVIERYLNNTYNNGIINSKELAIFRYGAMRGTAFLITDFAKEDKSRMYQVWVPSLRKVRRFVQADINDQWLGTQLSFGDTTLRMLEDESHELLGSKVYDKCLETIEVDDSQFNSWFKMVYPASCEPQDKEVYVLKSKSSKERGYDYRITYVDKISFADYRTEYYRNGELVKSIEKDWRGMGMQDPRVMYWTYWYVKNYKTGSETYIQMAREGLKYDNSSNKNQFWSEATLRKMHR